MSDVMSAQSGFEIDLTQDYDDEIPDTERAPFVPLTPAPPAPDAAMETGLAFSVLDFA